MVSCNTLANPRRVYDLQLMVHMDGLLLPLSFSPLLHIISMFSIFEMYLKVLECLTDACVVKLSGAVVTSDTWLELESYVTRLRLVFLQQLIPPHNRIAIVIV